MRLISGTKIRMDLFFFKIFQPSLKYISVLPEPVTP
jgi:hypothetical protein